MTPSEKACIEIVLLINERMISFSESPPTDQDALNQLVELMLKVTAVANRGFNPDQAGAISNRLTAALSLLDQAVVAERNHDEQSMQTIAANACELAQRALRGEI